jgi:hypothetical protein
MNSSVEISLPITTIQIFELAQQLAAKDKSELIYLLEQEQYFDNIPEEHKNIVRRRIEKYNQHPEKLVGEREALKIINAM